MRLSVCCPILNEAWFVDLWLQSVLSYADDIVILDGGSTDGTLDIIDKYKDDRIQLIEMPQEGKPYSEDWDEGERRNLLIDRAKGDYVLVLDADEMIGDEFINFIKPGIGQKFYGFYFVPFWRDINTVRLNGPNDYRWYKQVLYRMFPKGHGWYSTDRHHCVLTSDLEKRVTLIGLFHYHYALNSFGHKLKPRDNRRGDLGFPFSDIINGPINWNYGSEHPELFGDWKIITEEFKGRHPKIIQEFFKRD